MFPKLSENVKVILKYQTTTSIEVYQRNKNKNNTNSLFVLICRACVFLFE